MKMPSAAASSVLLVLAVGAATARAADDRTYRVVDVAAGVHAFIAGESTSGFVSGNSVAIVGRDGVLVVDSGHVPAMTRLMIEDIRRWTDRPVRYLVSTHWHPDHTAGDGEYRKAFPGLVHIATSNAARQVESVQHYLTRTSAALPGYRRTLEERLQSNSGRDGQPLSDRDRRLFAAQLRDIDGAATAFAEARVDPPDVTFEHDLTVDLGDRVVRVVHPGRGNTAGDAVVYVPDAKVLVTGDLLVLPTPYAIGSFLGDWIGATGALLAYDAAALVPGHGDVQHDGKALRDLGELLRAVVAQVAEAVKTGASLDDVRKAVTLESFRDRYAGDDGARRQAFDDYFVTPGIERAFLEAKFVLGGESVVINGK
ncbi:MAG: MBL fold metallo-hydrolase [Vicinamibacterales bacterium]